MGLTKDALEKAAREYLLNRFPEYRNDESVMHVDVEVFKAGHAAALESHYVKALEKAMERAKELSTDYFNLATDTWGCQRRLADALSALAKAKEGKDGTLP
jgi:hypothetical protein